MTEGAITSLLIIAVCFAGLHSIVNLRREQARMLGVPYMDKIRAGRLVVAGVVVALFIGATVLASQAGW